MTDNNVVCIKFGTKYSADYVNKLYSMVKRNITIPYRFVCLTDDPTGLYNEIEAKPLLVYNDLIVGWWQKLTIFKPQIYDLHGNLLFLDLDLLILSCIDSFFEYRGDMNIINDWWWSKKKLKKYNSSIMKFQVGSQSYIWDLFETHWQTILQKYPGDQDFLTDYLENVTTWPEDWCKSFKWHAGHENVDTATKIMIFHGNPNPPEAIVGYKKYPAAPWIANVWR